MKIVEFACNLPATEPGLTELLQDGLTNGCSDRVFIWADPSWRQVGQNVVGPPMMRKRTYTAPKGRYMCNAASPRGEPQMKAKTGFVVARKRHDANGNWYWLQLSDAWATEELAAEWMRSEGLAGEVVPADTKRLTTETTLGDGDA